MGVAWLGDSMESKNKLSLDFELGLLMNVFFHKNCISSLKMRKIMKTDNNLGTVWTRKNLCKRFKFQSRLL